MGRTDPQYPLKTETSVSVKNVPKLLLFSAVGIFMFFIPIRLGDSSTIPLDHIVTWLRESLGPLFPGMPWR